MKQEDVHMFPNLVTPADPVVFNEEAGNGCNRCVERCVMDMLLPNPEKGKPPIALYPDECYYDGLCVVNCPSWHKGAINSTTRSTRRSAGRGSTLASTFDFRGMVGINILLHQITRLELPAECSLIGNCYSMLMNSRQR